MIPYKSSNEMMLSIAAEQTLYAFPTGRPPCRWSTEDAFVPSSITGDKRAPELPDVPSMSKSGFPDVDVHLWSGVFAPAATPPAIVKKLEDALRAAIKDPAVQDKLKAMAVTPGGNSWRNSAR